MKYDIPNIKKYANIMKAHLLTLLWDWKLFIYLIVKDFIKIISYFNKNHKQLEKFRKKYLEERNKKTKIKKFGKFIFVLRNTDIFSLIEVFVDKEYTSIENFIPTKGNIVLDLGSGIGDYTILSSIKVGSSGRVISVESDEATFQLLTENIRRNKLKNVVPLKLFMSSGRKNDIDYIARKFKLKKLDLVKMDIEGEEFKVIKSSRWSITKFRPKIVIEVHSRNLRNRILKLLQKYKYVLHFERMKREYGFYLDYFIPIEMVNRKITLDT